MQAVSDATPLIHLSKISKISYLKHLFNKIIIPKEVFNEIVVKGREFNKKDVILIEQLIEENFIVVKESSSKITIPNLHSGELKIKNLMIDDKEGFDAALILGLHPLRTTSLLLRLLHKKRITFNEYNKSLLNLSESGYFLRAEIYEKLLEAGRKVK